MSKYSGQFFWYDVMTTDNADAERFYRNVVGWKVQDSKGVDGASYKVLLLGESGVGGIMPIPPDAKKAGAGPMWSGYVAVDDVDDYAERVKHAGGALLKAPTDVPGILRFAVVADPQGAGFLIFKGSMEEPPTRPMPPTPGTIGWHELHAADWEKVFPFYEKLFGWQKRDVVDMGPMGKYQLFASGSGDAVGGFMTDTKAKPYWLYYICVEDIDAAAARVTKEGGQVVNPPHQVPGGAWILHGRDPQGALFALVGPRA